MDVDNWFFGLAVFVPAKAVHHNVPRTLLCPEDRVRPEGNV
jgi:hypothetical protein